MHGWGRDIRDAWRGLRTDRGFALAAVLMLALGAGTTSAIYAAIQAAFLRIPFDAPDRIVTIHARDASGDPLRIDRSRFVEWRTRTDVFERIAAYSLVSPVLSAEDGALRLQAEAVTADMFAVLGVRPVLGRTFEEGESGVVVLSHRFWHTRFAGDPRVIGQTLRLDGDPHTVIGVMPEAFEGPRSRPGDVWLSMAAASAGTSQAVSVVGRLAQGVSPAAAGAALEALPWDASPRRWSARVTTAREDFLLMEVRDPMRVLGVGVALVLVMACVNVLSLLLGRNLARRRELAVRMALGATPWRIIRQLAVEALVLALPAGLLAVAVASGVVALMVPLVPGSFPRLALVRVDAPVVIFALLCTLCAALLVALVPAWSAARGSLTSATEAGGRATSRAARRVRTGLVFVQAVLAMVVLATAAMTLGSLARLAPSRPGFELDDRTKFSVRLSGARYAAPAARVAAVRAIADALRGIPGVRAAGSVTQLPLTGTTTVFPLASPPLPSTARRAMVHFRAVLPGYFEIMGIRLIAGRDVRAAEPAPVVLVNQTFATRVLPGVQPLGASIVLEEPGGPVTRRVVGIVADTRFSGGDLGAVPEAFVPYAQAPLALASFVVHAPGAGRQIEGAIREALVRIDPLLPLDRLEPMTDVAGRAVMAPRLLATLMTVFALAGLVLAFGGLYAATAWSVTQRTREIGIRMALGATPQQVRQMIVRFGAAVGLAGAAVGSALAFSATSLLASQLHGYDARQPWLYITTSTAFVAVLVLAASLPARRATRIEPLVALRAD